MYLALDEVDILDIASASNVRMCLSEAAATPAVSDLKMDIVCAYIVTSF
jgi:hypothetical protein